MELQTPLQGWDRKTNPWHGSSTFGGLWQAAWAIALLCQWGMSSLCWWGTSWTRAIKADALDWLYPFPGRILALGLRQTTRAVALLRLVRGAHVHPQNYPRTTLGKHCIFSFFINQQCWEIAREQSRQCFVPRKSKFWEELLTNFLRRYWLGYMRGPW